ncbi:hypothetical protein [Flavobacterium daejeonense]|uniref:hypothetical protein n=1 Tax=Flavobacterium daejeonense TaxID=350893 RepID=UPI00047DA303|nr:hypothetical protein [Flavobacterium daejeonense]
MTDKQIKYLEDFKKNKLATCGKSTDFEIEELVADLKSLNIISEQKSSRTLKINDKISFDKLIDLKSLSEFEKWHFNKEKSIVYNINDSTIGQINQSSNFSNTPQTNNITANNKADLKTKTIVKFWKLISENKLISTIIFALIIYLIKLIWGIDLK